MQSSSVQQKHWAPGYPDGERTQNLILKLQLKCKGKEEPFILVLTFQVANEKLSTPAGPGPRSPPGLASCPCLQVPPTLQLSGGSDIQPPPREPSNPPKPGPTEAATFLPKEAAGLKVPGTLSAPTTGLPLREVMYRVVESSGGITVRQIGI